MKNDVYNQIKSITFKLIETNISISQNFPKRNGEEISWEGERNLSFILKDSPYPELYQSLIDNKDYNFLLLDGGIVQLKYLFKREDIIKQVLLYYPPPNSLKFIDDPEDYEEMEYGTKMFTENLDQRFMAFPIRFDYTNSDFVEFDHPYSHATLGNYSDCRIPVCGPISPLKFVGFILRSFYFIKYKEVFSDETFFNCPLNTLRSITKSEEKILHFNSL